MRNNRHGRLTKPLGNCDDFVLIGDMKKIGFFTLLAVLAVSGCSEPLLYQKGGDTTVFRENKTDGTVFFTAVYDNPNDKPTFDDVFRLHADQGYVGDIDDAHYADTRLQPGHHTLSVDRLDWTGYTINQSHLDVYLAPSQTIYVEERVHSDDTVTFAQLDPVSGRKNIVTRKRTCNCGNMFGWKF